MTSHNLSKLPKVTHLSPEQFLKFSHQRHRPHIGRTALYEALRRGDIPHVRIGRRILIPIDALDIMLETQRSRDVH